MDDKKDTKEELVPVTKRKILLTICLFIAFGTLGLANSLTGPSLLHLSYIYNATISKISITFICNAFGYLVGSLTCAFVFDRFNQELQFFLACFDMGFMTTIAPWMPNVYGYFTAMGLANIGKGFIDAAGQSYVIALWHGHRFKNPAMQASHAIWAVGAFICPLCIAPFLIDLPEDMSVTDASRINNISNSNITQDLEGLEQVRYPYAIVGIIGCLLSFSYFTAFCITRKQSRKDTNTKNKHNQEKKPLQGDKMSFKYPIMTMQVMFYFFYIWYEVIPGGLLSAFVIKGLNWSVPSGPRITSLYWASSGVGRITGIPLSAVLSPGMMLTGNIAVTTIAFILMGIAANTSDILMWISASMAGFAMSTTFASAILWTSNHMTITGAVGASFLIASSLGGLTGPALAAFLFEKYTHMWMVYLSFLACIAHIIIFSAINIFTKVYESKTNKNNERDVIGEESRTLKEMKPLKQDEIFSSAQHL